MALKLKYISVFLFLVLGGCFSLPRSETIQKSDEDLAAAASFYLYPIQLGPTLSDTSEVSRRLNEIHEKAKEQITAKGYVIGPVKSADSLIKIEIKTAST